MADAEATLTSYREFVQRDKQAAASFAAATARRHARELDALRRTIDELTSEVEGLQWAKQMAVGFVNHRLQNSPRTRRKRQAAFSPSNSPTAGATSGV